MTEEHTLVHPYTWDAIAALALSFSMPARRVLLAALRGYLFDKESPRFLARAQDEQICGSFCEEYEDAYNVDTEEAERQIRQGCAELLDTRLVHTEPGRPDEEVQSSLISECTMASGASGLMFNFRLSPTLSLMARHLDAFLYVEEWKERSTRYKAINHQ